MAHSPSRKFRALALNTVGAFFGLTAIYHLATVLWPRLDDHGPVWRHWLFVFIDINVAFGLFRRPRFFFWLFGLLGLQQLHSHGSAFVHELARSHRVDWQSLLVLAIFPFAAWLLWLERSQPSNRTR